jgi:hypothetical protein
MAIGGAVGFVLGLLVSGATDIPLVPEVGLLLGVLIGWVSHA